MKYENYGGRINAAEDWMNGGYDENGEEVLCDICDEGVMRWNEDAGVWVCDECGRTMTRQEYFDWIGANPPGKKCLNSCCENYPFCKKYCCEYDIPEDDPML